MEGTQFPKGQDESKVIYLGGGNSNMFFIFTPIPGEVIQFDLRIYFKWVGSTTNSFTF